MRSLEKPYSLLIAFLFVMEKEIEIWKDIPDYKGMYSISNFGIVKSLERTILKKGKHTFPVKGRILKQRLVKGYFFVGLSKNGVKKLFSIHQLIAITFLGHTPNGHVLVVDHINSIKTDNRLCNLQLITNRQNIVKDIKNKTSKYTGVSWSKQSKDWRADIRHNGIRINLGRYKNEIQASEAYNNYLNTIT